MKTTLSIIRNVVRIFDFLSFDELMIDADHFGDRTSGRNIFSGYAGAIGSRGKTIGFAQRQKGCHRNHTAVDSSRKRNHTPAQWPNMIYQRVGKGFRQNMLFRNK